MKDQGGREEDTVMGINSFGRENHSGKEEDPSFPSETEEVSLLPILSSSHYHLVYFLTGLLSNLVLLLPVSPYSMFVTYLKCQSHALT